MRQDLTHLTEELTDELILATMLMAKYDIFQLRACLFRGERAPASICNGSWHVTSSPAASLDLLMIRVTNVRAEMFGMTCKEPLASNSEEQYRDVITETEGLDLALERWLCCNDNGLSVDVSKTESDAPPCTIDHAVLWTQYCAARMLLTDSRRRLLETKYIDPSCRPGATGLCASVQQLTDQLARQLQCAIAYLVTVIVDTTGQAYMSGKTRTNQITPKAAMVIAWPMAIALSIDAIPQPQKQWLQTMAGTAAEVLGLDVMLPTDTGSR
ncbi:hypothetical protein LTR27_004052 [Elasticomyces elasticus]|nr:hypothetical protein LTR27_004052 [Elasticomyces elasticus]